MGEGLVDGMGPQREEPVVDHVAVQQAEKRLRNPLCSPCSAVCSAASLHEDAESKG